MQLLNYLMMQRNLFRRYFLSSLAICTCLTLTFSAKAQQELLKDQNPRYRESMNHYLVREDSLTMNEGTTVQQTYKAYQYFEAKRELRDQRRQWRQERRLATANTTYWGDYGYNDYNYGYGYPYNNYGYSGYGHFGHHNRYYSGFRWNDVATVTALALGTYILFR
jgi:hypothetical protein